MKPTLHIHTWDSPELRRIWTRSMSEELLAVLYLIAGLLAWQAGIRWLAWCLFVKAAIDTVCSIGVALAEVLKERKEKTLVGGMR